MTDLRTKLAAQRIVQRLNGRWWVTRPIVQPELAEGVLHLVVDRFSNAVTVRVPLDEDEATLEPIIRQQLEAA